MRAPIAVALCLAAAACGRTVPCSGANCDFHSDICDPDAGDVCGAGAVDAGLGDAGPRDAGPGDAGAGDGGPADAATDAGSTAIVEEFLDDSALDLDASTAVIDPGDGGALVALRFVTSDDCRIDYAPDASVTFDGGALLKVHSLHLAPNVQLVGHGPLEIRSCGDVTIDPGAYLASDGDLRLTAWGKMTVGGLVAAAALYLALPDAGTSLTMPGELYVPSNSAGPSGALRIFVNGDVTLGGNSQLFAEGAPDASVPPLTIVAAGKISLGDSAKIFTDDGQGPRGGAPSIDVRAGGDIALGGYALIALQPGATFVAPRSLALTAGGGISLQSRGVFVSVTNGPSAISLAARGDLVIDGGFLSISNNESDAGPGVRIDFVSGGAFVCDGNASLEPGDWDRSPPYSRLPGDWGGSLSVAARSVTFGACFVTTSGAGPSGQGGRVEIVAGDGGVRVGPGSGWYLGTNTCSAGEPLDVASAGDIFVAQDAGLFAGASVGLLDGGCAPAAGGIVTLRAAGAVDAGGAGGGAGSPDGSVVVASGATVDAGAPRATLTVPYLGVSRVYDLGAAARVTGVLVVERPRPPEGGVLVELSMSDAADAGFSAWTSDAGTLGAHRYLRWRATVDSYFLQSAGIDRLEIDYSIIH